MSDSTGTGSGRLSGWKEIAGYLGKGARTVQRWEKLYGLPVHREGREGGEIVYAFRDEVDGWMKDAAPGDPPRSSAPPELAPPASPRSARRWLAAGLLLAGTAAALVAVSWLRPTAGGGAAPASPGAARQPAGWRLANESLLVFDAAGALLFRHRFGYPVGTAESAGGPPAQPAQPPVLIADVDGDERAEVLVRAPGAERTARSLYCFEADGRLRFVHRPTCVRRFGSEDYAEPWIAFRLFVTRGPGGAKRLWSVFVHSLLFPAVLRELDPKDGAVRQEYWSNGYIEVVREVSWNGRHVVLAGGTSNDFRAASLAVFAPDQVEGSAPAVRPAYACRDCPPGGPEALLVFPSLCLARRAGQAGVHDVWVEKDGRLRVSVAQGGDSAGTVYAFYTLGPDGSLLGAEISRELQASHERLERAGALDHPFGARDVAALFPVRRWNGSRFVDLPRVPVAH